MAPAQNEKATKPAHTPQVIQWAPPGSPISIDYHLDVMSKIRDHVIVGFHRLAKRGIECGGILYGHREGRRITISEIREIRCEYKTGPSFQLSEADCALLAEQLNSTEPALAGLTPVGFYVSHTKDDICLTQRDADLFHKFFPDPWQISLVLRPARQGAVRAGFFVREPLGGLQSERSYEEFQLEPPDSAAETAALMAAARMPLNAEEKDSRAGRGSRRSPGISDQPAIAPASSSVPALDSASRDFSPFPEFRPPLLGSGGGAEPTALQSYASRTPAMAVLASEQPDAMRFRSQQMRRSSGERNWNWLVVWVVAILSIAGASFWLLSIRTPAPILLRVAEQNGDLRIEWDRSSPSVRGASEGSLEIRSGDRTRDIRLSPEQLALGSYLFPSGSSDTAVRLSVVGFLRPRVEESANFVGEATAGAGPRGGTEVREQRDRLLRENRRLKNEVKRLEARLKSLDYKAGPTPVNPEPKKIRFRAIRQFFKK